MVNLVKIVEDLFYFKNYISIQTGKFDFLNNKDLKIKNILFS